MKLGLSLFEETEKQESALHKELKLQENVRGEIALNTVHALNDLTRSLADLHPHKRSIATLGALPEPLSKVAQSFASQGYHVQEIPVSFLLSSEEALMTAWNALKKDTLFVLCSEVEPFTGALYPIDFVRRESPKKSIFTLIYQSPDALTHTGVIFPQTAFEGIVVDPLWGEKVSLAYILKGERCHGEKLLWGSSHFNPEAVAVLREALLQKRVDAQDRAQVLEFENQMKMHMGHSVHFLGDKTPRYYDRAVLFVEGVDGEALATELKKSNILSFTASACAWDSPHLNTWLPKLGLPASWVQASLFIPAEELKKNILEKVIASIQVLREISGFQS